MLESYLLVALYNTGDMAVTIEIQNTGDSRARREILAGVEHVLSDVAGEWRVSIVGSRANDNWEMKVEGPRGFERSYTLVGDAGEHQLKQYGTCLLSCCPRGRDDLPQWFACPTAEADIAELGLLSFFEEGRTSDEEHSEIESSSQRAYFASVEQD